MPRPLLTALNLPTMGSATYPGGVSSGPRHGIISYEWLKANREQRVAAPSVLTTEAGADALARSSALAREGDAVSAERLVLEADENVASSTSGGLDGYIDAMAEKERQLFGDMKPSHDDYRARHRKGKKGPSHPEARLPWQRLLPQGGKQAGPKILAFRADGMEPQKKPEWTSDRPVEEAREDTRAIVAIIRGAIPLIDAQWGRSKIAQFFLPQGFHFTDKVIRVLVGADPTPGDEEGFANASAGMDEEGNLDIMSGADPKPGSDASKITAPVWKDKGVFRHEMGHTLVDEIYRSFGLQLDYSSQAGAGFHESFADCLAITAGQMLDLGGAQLTDANGGQHFKIGDIMVIGAALRHALFPGSARPDDHEFGPDLQEDRLTEFSPAHPAHAKIIQRDLGGVHHLNSIGNVGFSRTTLGIQDKENAQAALTMFMGAEILAAATGNDAPTYFEQAQLWIASAYIEFGIKAAENVRAAFESVEALPPGLPPTAEIITAMNIDALVEKMKTDGPPAVSGSLQKNRHGGR
jgi:hypothetical protein